MQSLKTYVVQVNYYDTNSYVVSAKKESTAKKEVFNLFSLHEDFEAKVIDIRVLREIDVSKKDFLVTVQARSSDLISVQAKSRNEAKSEAFRDSTTYFNVFCISEEDEDYSEYEVTADEEDLKIISVIDKVNSDEITDS